MKKIALGMITILLFGIKTIKAQELELSDSEPISNGCLSRSTEEEASALPTIKLTKEGSILSVDLLNYSSVARLINLKYLSALRTFNLSHF